MKGKSILEAVIVFILLQVVLSVPEGVRNLVRWENRILGGSYFSGALMIALTVFMIIIRRYDLHDMGAYWYKWRKSINYGIRGWSFFIIPQYLISLILTWGFSYIDNMELAILHGATIIITALFMARRNETKPATNGRLLLIGAVLISPIAIKLLYDDFSVGLLKEYVWNILVGGFAEEFFYRGYIQSSINLEYQRNWKLGKIKFGPGLLISSMLYGLGRGARSITLRRGVYSVSRSWVFFAFTVGLFYGLIRESSGDIIGSGTANSLINAFGEALVN